MTNLTVKNTFYNLYFFFQQHVLAVDKVNNSYLTYNSTTAVLKSLLFYCLILQSRQNQLPARFFGAPPSGVDQPEEPGVFRLLQSPHQPPLHDLDELAIRQLSVAVVVEGGVHDVDHVVGNHLTRNHFGDLKRCLVNLKRALLLLYAVTLIYVVYDCFKENDDECS